ncbi:hypothetical protein PF003_g11604 [Phytophthora fragariae]|nr:hypothetical protein PF003_g11604 [Phytophthora fragariae]
MDPAIFSTVSDDELLREALAVLDNSFDFGDLDTLTPLMVEDASDSIDDLLKAVMDVARQDATPSSILEDSVSTTAIQGQETRSGTQHQSTHGHARSGSSSHIEDAVEKLTPAGRGHGQGRVRLREQLIQLRSVIRDKVEQDSS